MTTPHDLAPVTDREDEEEYTICQYCGEDLPHHVCGPKGAGTNY